MGKGFIILLSFFIFAILIPNPNFAQSDSTFYFKKPEDRYYYSRTGKWMSRASTLGIIPEVHGFDNLVLGLNIAEVKSSSGEGALFGKAYQLGIEYIPTQKIIAPKVKYWKAGWAYILGGNIGGSGLYYFKKEASSFALRPEVGLGVVFFQINYGYTIFFNDKFKEISPHTFSVSWYHTILPRKKEK